MGDVLENLNVGKIGFEQYLFVAAKGQFLRILKCDDRTNDKLVIKIMSAQERSPAEIEDTFWCSLSFSLSLSECELRELSGVRQDRLRILVFTHTHTFTRCKIYYQTN